jgi:CDP-diacylglycerol--serine O-phosphatidyltransferase
VAGLIWVAVDNQVPGENLRWLAWGTTVFAGVTMVSNLRFYSGKDINLRKSVPFIAVVLVALGFILISADPPTVLFALFVGYGLSGYGLWLFRRLRRQGSVEQGPN